MKKLIILLAMSGILAHAATTPKQPTWTGSWAASPLALHISAPPAAAAPSGTPAASPAPAPSSPATVPAAPNTSGTTYRDIVHLSLGGSALRLRISNEFGATSLTLGGVHVALSNGGNTIQPTTDHTVTFGGAETVTIPAGALAVSDAVAMPVAPFANLAVSIFIPYQPDATLTYHALGTSSNFIVPGNVLTAATLDAPKKVSSWYLLKGVDVDAGANAYDVVTLGDSITDGAKSSIDHNARWPDVLAARLQANPKTAKIGVLNEGISGNRVLHDGAGPNALARFDRDVLSQGSVKYLIILLGINDIGNTMRHPGTPDAITADQLIWGLQQLAVRAHARGIKVYGATLTPYGGAGYQDATGSAMRDAVNNFIRTSGDFDAVIDFDKVTRDPAHPETFLPLYDSGDHLHPGDAGYKAMGESIDLKLFQ
ncbi:MAG TPA: SGNH/GDSL hydrolase family protein [Acidobacteriaceae bacterium]